MKLNKKYNEDCLEGCVMSKEKWFFLILMVIMNVFLVSFTIFVSVLAGINVTTGFMIISPLMLPFLLFCVFVWYVQFKL